MSPVTSARLALFGPGRVDFEGGPGRVCDLVVHQAAWWCTVLAARQGLGTWGALAVAVYLGLHLSAGRRAGHAAVMALSAATLGLLGDTLLLNLEFVSFPSAPAAVWRPGLGSNRRGSCG